MSNLFDAPEEKRPFYLKQNQRFSEICPEDDHPESFRNVKEDSATETQYFGFSVPEQHIHAVAYMWWHPNLKLCTGGLFVFQGVKETMVHAELCNWRTFMSDAAIRNDLHEFRFASGYGVKVLEPPMRMAANAGTGIQAITGPVASWRLKYAVCFYAYPGPGR